MKPIKRYSTGYQLTRYWIRFTLGTLFFKRFEIKGLEKIDPNKPIILAPNHQNALIDALLVGISLKQQPVFLARADIFENDIIVAILRFLRMLPVYRIRDGFDSLKKNEDIFDQCVEYLGNKNTLILFPEGNHGSKRHYRPLKKGLARIAFEAEKKHDFKLGIQVIPVGIDYADYRKFRGKTSVRIGDPIELKDLRDLYEENPQKGLRNLNLLITKGIEPHMIEIPWMEQYDNVMNIREVYGEHFHLKTGGTPKKNLLSRFDSHKKLISLLGGIIEKAPEKSEDIGGKAKIYFKKLDKLNFRDHVLGKSPYSGFNLLLQSLAMLITLPLYLYGMINNFLVFKIPDYITIKKIKDYQFRSSIAYALAFVALLPILYIIQLILVMIFTPTWWIPLLYFLSLIPSGLLAIQYSFWYKKMRSKWKFFFLAAKKNSSLSDLIELRKSIIDSLDEIIDESVS